MTGDDGGWLWDGEGDEESWDGFERRRRTGETESGSMGAGEVSVRA